MQNLGSILLATVKFRPEEISGTLIFRCVLRRETIRGGVRERRLQLHAVVELQRGLHQQARVLRVLAAAVPLRVSARDLLT